MSETDSTVKKTKRELRRAKIGKALWLRIPILAVIFIGASLARIIFLFIENSARGLFVNSFYAFPWLVLALGSTAILIWRVKAKETPALFLGEKAPREKGARKRWVLWALGIRSPQSDAQYGERLLRYRRWSSIPVAIMSIAVFLLIILKMWFAFSAIFAVMGTLNEETVVAQYMSGMSEADIITSFMGEMIGSVLHASPLWLQIPLLILWLLAFVVDFIVAATLAEQKKLWWKRH